MFHYTSFTRYAVVLTNLNLLQLFSTYSNKQTEDKLKVQLLRAAPQERNLVFFSTSNHPRAHT